MKLAYISFDTVPAPKGSATHIQAFSKALAARFGSIQLVTVSSTSQIQGPEERWPGVWHTQIPALGSNLISRVLHFRALLMIWLQDQVRDRRFDIIHFRSIFEGFELCCQKYDYSTRLIFEVNGLPSIELKYKYPAIVEDRILMHKIYSQEQICLEVADQIITPSSVTAGYLATRGIPLPKIQVIPNGVDLTLFTYAPNWQPQDFLQLAYFGVFSSWQGLEHAIRALASLQGEGAVVLSLIGPASRYQRQRIFRLAAKLGVSRCLKWLGSLSQLDLVKQLHQSDIILAPLSLNDRNLLQGCCPLKILEGMAVGIPVISSHLPVVQELGENGIHLWLTKPGSVDALCAAVLEIKKDPSQGERIRFQARQRIESHFTWDYAGKQLNDLYQSLMNNFN
jgi:glycosyltransferase involved in cell wall biosynthesis